MSQLQRTIHQGLGTAEQVTHETINMPQREFPIPPTRVNKAFILGPRFHFNNISESQLSTLGLAATTRADGVSIRKLRNGNFNVVIDHAWQRSTDARFAVFMKRMRVPQCPSCPSDDKYLCDCARQRDFEHTT